MHVRMVLETLRHHKLYAKASKCQFGRSSVGFLGHVISERGVAVDPRKVAAVAEWATPTSCTDVRRFVGLANYYRKFVLRFSALAAPLTALCSPRAQFTWGPAEQQSFDALKAALTSAPVLRVWDPARPTRLLTDASELAVSAILEQPDDAGAFHPVAFESRKLTPPERSYPPHLLELLAVVHALKTLRPYLLDQPFQCTPTTRAYSGCSSSGTSVIIRRAGQTCASPTARVLRRTRATPSRTQPSSCSPRPARLLRSWLPAPPQSPLASCTPISRPRFAWRSADQRGSAAAQAQASSPGAGPGGAGGESLAARLRLAGRATLPSQPARRPPLRARRASDAGAG